MTKVRGTLYLVPVLLGDTSINDVLPEKTISVASKLKFFIAENAKSARAFLKQVSSFSLSEIEVLEIDKHNTNPDFDYYFKSLREGNDIGLVSEAGMPGVADPGSQFVLQAHREQIKVVPLTGPSSILLSLAASGMNGQGFRFHGYLPKEHGERIAKIRELEKNAQQYKVTQIFIETPYRNNSLLKDILQTCRKNTLLCIASEISSAKENIRTMSVGEWQRQIPQIDKLPTVFLLL